MKDFMTLYVPFLGWLSDPNSKDISDLQLWNQQVTLNHLAVFVYSIYDMTHLFHSPHWKMGAGTVYTIFSPSIHGATSLYIGCDHIHHPPQDLPFCSLAFCDCLMCSSALSSSVTSACCSLSFVNSLHLFNRLLTTQEINMSPEKEPFQKENSLPTSIFQGIG